MVALDDDTVDVLKRHRERQDADRFTQEDGSWLHPGKVTDLFERLVTASELPPIRLHDLRHGAATLMLAADIDIKIVSDTLGHSDTWITRDIYQSVLPQVVRSAAEATAKLVPLQRKAEAEKAARKAAKKEKAKRPKPQKQVHGRIRSRIAHAGKVTTTRPCDPSCPEQQKTPGERLCDLGV
ncbi:tyrosine-type recombinase/integrase [Streptomyces sp. NPDC058534]|uniref:tyrosine-type recombinase/integrase n=1 Tax=Streptomyces sp. NPDC058534 TaxID=3346541 RepID=UPI0036601DF8